MRIALRARGSKDRERGFEEVPRLCNEIGWEWWFRLHDRNRLVALSADGKTALTGSRDQTARLWETATGKPIGPPLQHQDIVVAVALSADGKTALTGSFDNTARLWKAPQPMRGDPERLMLWTQVTTGFEVDELTAVRVLDAATWEQRRQRLQELGGPP